MTTKPSTKHSIKKKVKEFEVDTHQLILNTIEEKHGLKKQIYSNTLQAFNFLKASMREFTERYTSDLQRSNPEASIEFNDRGTYEAELQVAGDMIVFNMHTNIFGFYQPHAIYATDYVNNDLSRANCGIIHIYNFLHDSFKYDRVNDLGYLIGRIFINKDNHYFIEGKRQLGLLYNDFENAIMSQKEAHRILDSTVLFSLDFDLLVPEYEDVAVITVGEMKENINSSKTKTAKRLGFYFSPDSSDY